MSRLLLGLCIVGLSAHAAIYRVPQDIATIQSAMNEIATNDTILVAPGLYAEALIAPPLSFWLIGESSAEPCSLRAIVDPSQLLPGSDTLACLVIPEGCFPIIRNMCFHNREPLISRPGGAPGGIINFSTDVVLLNCHGDSLIWGLIHGEDAPLGMVTIDSCRFTNSRYFSVNSGPRIIASNSLFNSYDYKNFYAGSNSIVTNCTFSGQGTDHLAGFIGDSIRISNCVFGPESTWSWCVELTSSNAIMENCVFQNIRGGFCALGVWFSCGTDSVIVRNCLFENNTILPGWAGTGGMYVNYYDDPPCGLTPDFLAEGNVFRNLEGNTQPAAFFISAPARIFNNSFEDSSDGEEFFVGWTEWYTDVILRNNFFSRELLACNGWAYGDARWNYWGDASGPYHPVLNPEGLGAVVGENVDFIPWLTENPLDVSEPSAIASSFSILECHPNPFNSSVNIDYALLNNGHVSLGIFDILGRKVETLVNERKIAGVHRAVWHADEFASGIYFAKLSSDEDKSSRSAKLFLIK